MLVNVCFNNSVLEDNVNPDDIMYRIVSEFRRKLIREKNRLSEIDYCIHYFNDSDCEATFVLKREFADLKAVIVDLERVLRQFPPTHETTTQKQMSPNEALKTMRERIKKDKQQKENE